jgi:hypothetical protein
MRESANRYFGAFFKELRRKGYAEGQNLAIERYSRSDVVAELVRDAISQSPDLIFATNGAGMQRRDDHNSNCRTH